MDQHKVSYNATPKGTFTGELETLLTSFQITRKEMLIYGEIEVEITSLGKGVCQLSFLGPLCTMWIVTNQVSSLTCTYTLSC